MVSRSIKDRNVPRKPVTIVPTVAAVIIIGVRYADEDSMLAGKME